MTAFDLLRINNKCGFLFSINLFSLLNVVSEEFLGEFCREGWMKNIEVQSHVYDLGSGKRDYALSNQAKYSIKRSL